MTEFEVEMKKFQSVMSAVKKIVQVKVVGDDPTDRLGAMIYGGSGAFVRLRSIQMGTRSIAVDLITQNPLSPDERIEVGFDSVMLARKFRGFPQTLPPEFFDELVVSRQRKKIYIRAVSSTG